MSKSNQSVHDHLTFTVKIFRYWTKFRLWHANLAKLRREKVWNSDGGRNSDPQLRIVDDNTKLVYWTSRITELTKLHYHVPWTEVFAILRLSRKYFSTFAIRMRKNRSRTLWIMFIPLYRPDRDSFKGTNLLHFTLSHRKLSLRVIKRRKALIPWTRFCLKCKIAGFKGKAVRSLRVTFVSSFFRAAILEKRYAKDRGIPLLHSSNSIRKARGIKGT